jgi:hypothetical protein
MVTYLIWPSRFLNFSADFQAISGQKQLKSINQFIKQKLMHNSRFLLFYNILIKTRLFLQKYSQPIMKFQAAI